MNEAAGMRNRVIVAAVAAVVATALVGTLLAVVFARRNQNALPTVHAVQPTDRIVPSEVARIPLVNQAGQTTHLADFHGKIVVLADFMTSCQEVCPITAGALMSVQRDLAHAHLLGSIEIVEATIDPRRDSPSRFRVYQRAFGIHWTMLTGTAANIDRLWSWFGVIYQRAPEPKPPAINWQTGRPYTYDVVHSDAVIVLDRAGTERAIAVGNPNVGGRLPERLLTLLDKQGRANLAQPGFGSWTPSDLIDAIGTVLGRSIPISGN
ncbi:MAG TPA: SCO family protein [Acidimicrobiales bacterium]|nr:SCO family protein [Acidimicrobiales bacterium]